nr:zinc finger BED domain-containing protein RICESLEEPER 2 [Tanacetum cinerariifolium]
MLKDIFKSDTRNYQYYMHLCKEAKKPSLSPNWDVTTRWNSTYHMFQCALKQKGTLMYFNETLSDADHSNRRAKNDRLMSSEYERYFSSDFISHLRPNEFAGFDVLGFWKANESMFPIISQMPRDMLSVQATSVAFESAFSTSGWALLIRRRRLTPASLEMCMCLNDHLEVTGRIQHASNLESCLDFEEEVQDIEAMALSEEEIALDEAASDDRLEFHLSHVPMCFKTESGIYSSMVKPMKKKFKKYFEKIPLVITCAAALNLCFSFHGVELLIESILTDLEFFDDGFATKVKELFNQSFQGLYNTYYLEYGDTTTQLTSGASLSRTHSGNSMTNLLNRLKDHSNRRAKNDRLTSSEYERYLSSDFISHLWPNEFAGFDVLGFWKVNESMFPIISRMPRDMLSVQATSVASESAFSTSGWVLSIRKTRLTPASLEMCMCLNDHLDVTDRIQHTSNLKNCLDFEEEILEEEVQDNEAIALSEEEIALDEAASDARSNGFSFG